MTTTKTQLTRLDFRRMAHDAERCLRNVRARDVFTLSTLERDLVLFRTAYTSAACEAKTARRIHAAIDLIEDAAEAAR